MLPPTLETLHMKKMLLASAALALTIGIAHAETAARHNLDAAQYQQQFEQIVAQGFRPTHVDGYATPNGNRYAGIWIKSASNRPWAARHGLNSAKFQQEFNTLVGQGFRLTDVSVTDGGLFSGIFQKGDGPEWYSFGGLTSDAFTAQFNEKTKAGFRAIDFEGYQEGGQMKYQVIWQKNTTNEGWYLWRDMTSAAYQAKADEMTSKGFRQTHVDGYGTPNGARFAAIFMKKGGAFIARHDMTGAQYQQEYDKQSAAGYELKDVSGYNDGGTVKFTAIWEK